MSPVRLGVLGAARITPAAIVKPARNSADAELVGIAARDRARADAFASKHGVPRVFETYADLLADPDIDAIYNPLPNGLHAEWTLKAIAAGKHVLCEKPFTANAAEAEQVADAVDASDRVVMEAFHYRYHELTRRIRTVVHDGSLGEISSVRAWLCFPLPKFSDIRYNFGLAGGASMDCCYPVHALRTFGPTEPTVVSATAKRLRGGPVDRAMAAEFRYANGAVGQSYASMWSHQLLRIGVHIDGSRGKLRALNFVAPHYYNRLRVTIDGKTTRERVKGEVTYDAQLRAFLAAVNEGKTFPTTARDAVVTMRLIDDIYRAAGLPLRGTDV
jgi:predicted dehydrogenase